MTAKTLFTPLFVKLNMGVVTCKYYKDLYLFEENKGVLTSENSASNLIVGFNIVDAEKQDDKGKKIYFTKFILNPTQLEY